MTDYESAYCFFLTRRPHKTASLKTKTTDMPFLLPCVLFAQYCLFAIIFVVAFYEKIVSVVSLWRECLYQPTMVLGLST